ncbi:hypothetical protein [Dysgonomonas sp. ZJ279]|uniref:hypothetical protein n=1 Tax=Dysgonomonas sp. ZJ279 TaxID=2709796 RepID=UPI0013EC3D9A|nr:hypothetical protein [Dysgonomonas sp. ZJ279]
MKRTTLYLFILTFCITWISCDNESRSNRNNIYARLNVQSYNVTTYEIDSSGVEESIGRINKSVEFDVYGNILKEFASDIGQTSTFEYNDTLLIKRTISSATKGILSVIQTSYLNNQKIDSLFNKDSKLYAKVTSYRNSQGRDTLVTRFDQNNQLEYKVTCIYDEIGLKDMTTRSNTDTVYKQRINDDKLLHIFESKNLEGKLIARETILHNKNGDEIDFLYESFILEDAPKITHRKTTYLDSGLTEEVVTLDAKGKPIRKEKYSYQMFDGEI